MKSYYDDCIVFLLAKAYQKAHAVFKNRLAAYGLTPVQNLILEVLWEQEALSIGDIGKRVSIDNATLSSILERMMASGWIVKKKNPADKRSWQVFLTDKAIRLKQDLLSAQLDTNRHMMENFSEPEKLLLFRMLKDLQSVVNPETESEP